MKILFLLLTGLFNQDDFLVKQGEVTVDLVDLDAYVYLLPADKRGGFAEDKKQIDKNIITLLNINIVYNYILTSGLINDETFSVVPDLVEQNEYKIDDDFFEKLNIDKEQFLIGLKNFDVKKEMYVRMRLYVKETLADDKINQIIKERFIVKKRNLMIPEKRDLSVIVLNEANHDQAAVVSVLEQAIGKDFNAFNQLAVEYSDDPSVELNQGAWSKFRKQDLNYPFADALFEAEIGVIPTVFSYDGNYYLVRVNEIIPPKEPDFDEYKNKVFENVKSELAEKKFQNIINTEGSKSPIVNETLAAHVFERYKILKVE